MIIVVAVIIVIVIIVIVTIVVILVFNLCATALAACHFFSCTDPTVTVVFVERAVSYHRVFTAGGAPKGGFVSVCSRSASSQVSFELWYSYPCPCPQKLYKLPTVPICTQNMFYKLSRAWAWV